MDALLLKCPGCGANLTVDNTNRIAECPYCHTKIFLENGKVKNYINKKITHVDHADTVQLYDESSSLQRLNAADVNMELGAFKDALSDYSKVTKADPGNYRGWMGCMMAETSILSSKSYRVENANILKSDFDRIDNFYRNALSTATSPEERKMVEKNHESFADVMWQRIMDVSKDNTGKINEILGEK